MLIDFIYRNNFTQAKACSVLASLCVDSAIRNELKTSGAIPTLVQLIQSNNDDVRFNSCWALTCASADFNIAVEFCRHGSVSFSVQKKETKQKFI